MQLKWSQFCAAKMASIMVSFFCATAAVLPAWGQLNENCVVSVLNRNVQVKPDGTWILPNIPANFGQVRARATCVENGVTRSGQSDLFLLPANGSINVPPIQLGATTPIPTGLTLNSPITTLTTAGATVQLNTSATFSDGTGADVTAAATGTQYTISNPLIATVTADGLVTAVRTGTVVVQATNEGTSALLSIKVIFGGGVDSDGDGIPDDYEIANGLNPNDPTDALADPDHDGLTNLQEFQLGTDPHNPDTDNDGLTDGQEVLIYHTNPLVADTDGDGIPDGVEVLTGTDPLNPASFNLSRAVSTLEVSPPVFTLIVNSLTGVAIQQLNVIGHLIDNHTTINLTSTARQTNYSSSDLGICNFGAPDGAVFAGSAGGCTITVTNNGHTATAQGFVQNFSPSPVSFVPIPGYANSVGVSGDYAYVAAGGAGLQVVSLSADRTHPAVVTSLPLAGNANDVAVVGNLTYVAMGSGGLAAVNTTNPLTPTLLGTLNISGNAMDVTIRGTTAFVANGSNFVLVDVTNPAAMTRISTLPLSGFVWGVDVDMDHHLAAVAAGTAGLYLIDITNPALPVVLGNVNTGDARQAAIRGNFVFVADQASSMTSVNITNPAAPVVVSNTPLSLGGRLNDIVLSGNFALGADVFFVNGIPIVDVSNPASLQPRAILNFTARDDNSMGIAVDPVFAYVATDHSGLNRGGSFGDSRLYIGQYQPRQDLAGIPPVVSITSPANGASQVEGTQITVTAAATDDIAVAAVQFLVNGQVAFTTTTVPYQYTFIIPLGSRSLTLGARAFDLGGNMGTASDIVLNVTPDPLTTLTGLVVDDSGNPAAGATITAPGSLTAITGADGRFSISGVATVTGNVFASATFVRADGVTLSGASASVPPVRGGVTDVGTIVVTQAQFETNFGTLIAVCDDCSVFRNLPFPFTFFGHAYTSMFINNNGHITFNFGDSNFTETIGAFPAQPRISAFWDDLVASSIFGFTEPSGQGLYINDSFTDHVVITWLHEQEYFSFGDNTIQAILSANGTIQFGYRGVTSLDGIVGITPGGAVPLQQVDYRGNPAFSFSGAQTVLEQFTTPIPNGDTDGFGSGQGPENRFNLDNGFIRFTPNNTSGYDVRVIASPAPASTGTITNTPPAPIAAFARVASVTAASSTTAATVPPPIWHDAEVIVRSSTNTAYVGMTNTDGAGNFVLNGVPPGAISVVIRRSGQVIANGSGVFAGGSFTSSQLLNISLIPVTGQPARKGAAQQ